MTPKILLLVFISLATLDLEVNSATIPKSQAMSAQNIPESFQHLGESDGRSYYVDTSVSLGWSEGGSHCRSAQLKLASIVTPAQAQFLADALISRNLQEKELWTMATDCCKLPELIWADSREAVENVFNMTTLSSPNACGVFSVSDLYGSVLSSRQCILLVDGVLCQEH